MSQLVKKIEGYVLPYIISEVTYKKEITALIQKDNYINLYGLTGFFQNLGQVNTITKLKTPMGLGVKNNHNSVTTILEINY